MLSYPEKQRYHELDSLRAAMMLLGVVLHSALSYATYTLSVFTPYRDPNNSYLVTGVTFLIHVFRMPAFFLVAGFFAAMLFYKLGAAGMLRNRAKRVLLPLCVSWVVLFPLTILGAAFTILGGPKGVSRVIEQLSSGKMLAQHNMTFGELLTQLGLIHLWFLYYLMIFYVVSVSFIALVRYKPERWTTAARRGFSIIVTNRLGIIVLSAITFLTMYTMPAADTSRAGIENSNAFLPPLRDLAVYLVFFAFGWMLCNQRVLLGSFRVNVWQNVVAGLCMAALYAFFVLDPLFQSKHTLQVGTIALATWLLVFGVIGIFIRYAQRPSPVSRYLADSSYWVYLVHLPLTLFLPGLLIGVDIPGTLKFLIVFSVTAFLSLFTYHYLVRATIIGKVLNGQRFPRSLPQPREFPADIDKELA